MLASDQRDLCRRFASKSDDKFAGVAHRVFANGSPVLDDVVAWIDCTLDAVHEAGDHFIVLGRVNELDIARRTALALLPGKYGAFAPLETT